MTATKPLEAPRIRPPAPRVTVRNDALRPQQQRIALLTIVGPTLGLLVGIAIAVERGFTTMDLTFLLVGIFVTQLCLEIGYHRLFAHRAFETHRWVRLVFGIGASMAGQGRLTHWVANHRRHHLHSDTPNDPHSPYVRAKRNEPGEERLGVVRGLIHAQWGHMLTDDVPNCTLFARDLGQDADLRWLNKHYSRLLWLGLLLPAGIGFLWAGTIWGALSGFLWGGLARMFVVQNVTWAVASASHRFGPKTFDAGDQSRNLIWTALPSFGSGYQNNHHAFPQAAHLGMRWNEPDISGYVITAMSWLRLVWNVNRPTDKQLDEKRLRPRQNGTPTEAI